MVLGFASVALVKGLTPVALGQDSTGWFLEKEVPRYKCTHKFITAFF